MNKSERSGMSLIVKTAVRIVSSFIFIFGVYIITYGHLSPGGGFPGGIIVGLGFVVVVLAFSAKTAMRRVSNLLPEVLDPVGAIIFWAVALLGLTGGFFFKNVFPRGVPFKLLSAGTIPVNNIAIGIKVSASLFLVFLVLAVFRRANSGKR